GPAGRDDAGSRGELPLLALAGRLPHDFAAYNAFNLLVVDAGGARVFTHTDTGEVARPVMLDPGVHVIVNEPFTTTDGPRARHAAALLANRAPGFDLLA